MTDLVAAFSAQLSKREPHVSQTDEPHAYASEAMKCRRQIAYRVAGVEGTDDVDSHTLVAWGVGNYLHEHIQAAYAAMYPDFRAEVSWLLPGLTGRADGLYTHPTDGPTVLEVKSMDGEKFAQAVESGFPSAEHMLQGDLSALALGHEWLDVVYVAKSRPKKYRGPAIHCWHYKADLSHAREEARILLGVVSSVADKHEVPAAVYEKQEITDPHKRVWPCRYCAWRSRCIEDGPGYVPLRVLP